jgi:uncharacterized protein
MSHLGTLSRRRGMRTIAKPATGPFASLDGATTVLLTTFRRNGEPVGTPVSVVWDGDRGWFRTWATAGKLTRIWNHPRVEVAPCTVRGRVTGPSVAARARILTGEEADEARHRMNRSFPLLHGMLVPLAHRARGFTTVHLELRPR